MGVILKFFRFSTGIDRVKFWFSPIEPLLFLKVWMYGIMGKIHRNVSGPSAAPIFLLRFFFPVISHRIQDHLSLGARDTNDLKRAIERARRASIPSYLGCYLAPNIRGDTTRQSSVFAQTQGFGKRYFQYHVT